MNVLNLILSTVLLATLSADPVGGRDGTDARALAVAESMMEAMGGRKNYEKARYLTFRFVPTRKDTVLADYLHAWDKHTGDYMVSGVDRSGSEFKVMFNIDSKRGQGWVDGKQIEGEELEAWLDRAHGRFINDTYWLLMPWKWLDPGVTLIYEAAEEIDGVTYDRIRLEFADGTGRTSADKYWGWVSRETRLMHRWGYVLQDQDGNPGTGDPVIWTWEDYADCGDGVFLSTAKRQLQGPVALTFPLAKFHREAPPELTTP